MIFDCGVCGQRKEIVGFKPDGFVPGVINVPKSIAMCRECIDIPKKETNQEEDNDYPF